MTDSPLILRLATETDEAGIGKLSQLDTSPPPAAPVLVAIEGGQMLAALSIADGHTVADPFRPTAAALDLLRLRAAHMRTKRVAVG